MALSFRLCTLLVLAALTACKGKGDATIARHKPVSFDTQKLDIDDFAEDAGVQRRVLYMPFGEAAARLGSLRYEAKSSFTFTRGTQDYDQADAYLAEQDSQENTHVLLDTPVSQIEVYVVDHETYVRQDKGQLRKSDRREMQAPTWTDIAWSSLPQALEVFRPRLRFTNQRQDTVAGRECDRYDLALGPSEPQDKVKIEALPTTQLPVTPPASWREMATALGVSGSVWIDRETGVPMKLTLTGKLEVPDREVRPTQLSITYEGAVAKVGEVGSIKAPKSRPEFRVSPPQPDPLAFFREHLPPPAEAPGKVEVAPQPPAEN
jgi:hypothetical protein